MRKTIQQAVAMSTLAGVIAFALGTSTPADAAIAEPIAPVGLSETFERTDELASCDLYKAREMCCPIWCAGKDKGGGFDAAKALKSCARGYACDWTDSPSHASFQCNSSCK
jgi:hypothetical protein